MVRAAGAALAHGLARVEDLLLTGLTAALVVLAGAQIVARLVFDAGWASLEPALRAMVLWIALLGAMVAAREDRHLAIDALSRFLGGGAARFARGLVYLGASAIAGALSWYSLALVRGELEAGTIAFAGVPAWAVESVMPVAFAAIALRFARHAFRSPRTAAER